MVLKKIGSATSNTSSYVANGVKLTQPKTTQLNMKLKLFFLLSALLVFKFFAFSLDVPAFTNYVVDNAKIIDANTEDELISYLSALEDTTGIQIAVLTIPTLEDEDLERYSFRVADTWQIGQRGKDNGALLLVAMAEHSVRIEVGYGLEDKLTDAKCGLIIRNIIIPEFKNERYSKGILDGIKNMVGIASDDEELVSKNVLEEKMLSKDKWPALIFGILFFFMWFMLVPNLAGRRSWWIPWFFYPSIWRQMSRTSRSNTFYDPISGQWRDNSNSNSGFTFSNFGGGDSFGGGGGGSFGGGGASGSW